MDDRRLKSILSDLKNGLEDIGRTAELIHNLNTSDNSDSAKCDICGTELEKHIALFCPNEKCWEKE